MNTGHLCDSHDSNGKLKAKEQGHGKFPSNSKFDLPNKIYQNSHKYVTSAPNPRRKDCRATILMRSVTISVKMPMAPITIVNSVIPMC